MTEYKLMQHENIQEDLLFWMRLFLVYKLASFDKSKVKGDFDISFYFNAIRDSKDIDKIKNLGNEIKKHVGSYNNTTNGLYKFYCFIEKNKINSLLDITSSVFNDDFINKELDGLSAYTVRDTKSAVKQLFDYIEEHNIYYEDGKPYIFNLTQDIRGKRIPLAPKLKQQKKIPKWLTEEELSLFNELIMKCTQFANKDYDFQRAKEVLIMKLLVYSGITASEVVNLHVKDIKEATKYGKKYILLNIRESSNLDREVPIPRGRIIRYWNDYIKRRDNKDSDLLFYNKLDNEKPVTTHYVLKIIEKIVKKTDLENKKITTEVLRNSYAVKLHNMGSPLLYIQELMGLRTNVGLKNLVSHADVEVIKATDKFKVTDFL